MRKLDTATIYRPSDEDIYRWSVEYVDGGRYEGTASTIPEALVAQQGALAFIMRDDPKTPQPE